jgi:hypothetical protein
MIGTATTPILSPWLDTQPGCWLRVIELYVNATGPAFGDNPYITLPEPEIPTNGYMWGRIFGGKTSPDPKNACPLQFAPVKYKFLLPNKEPGEIPTTMEGTEIFIATSGLTPFPSFPMT